MQIIDDRVLPIFEIVTFDEDEHSNALRQLARLDIRGGTIYDGLIAYAAAKAGAERIVTFNERHFTRVSAGLPLQIVVP